MADRTTKVTFTANFNNYLAGMDAASRKTQEFAAGSAQKLAAQKQAFTDIGHTALLAGGVIAAGLVVAVNAFSEFDAKMSQVHALSHASGDDMKRLSDAAMTAGTQIGFSAAQTADAEIELIKAGVSVSNILGGALKGSLELAAAGQIDVADATEIATIALTQFGLKGSDIPHVADLLAAGADKALGGVSDLGEALKSGGLVAAQFGVSLDETVGTLSAFANAGLLGETAGTDLRQMLLKLADPSAEAQHDMERLGISLYDQQGKFVGIANLAGQLHDKLGALDEATRNQTLATIFDARAIAGANVLYKEGAKGISDWTNNVNDTGFAAAQAAGKMDNLQGDITKLGAAFQNDLIKGGSGANDVLRGTVQNVTALVKTISGVPQPVVAVGVVIAGLTAGVLLLGGGFLSIVPKIAATKAAMAELNLTGRSLGKMLGKGGLIAAGLIGLEGALAGASSSIQLTSAQVSDLNSRLNNADFTGINKEFVDANGNITKMGDALDDLFSPNFFKNYYGGVAQLNGVLKNWTGIDLGAWADTNKAKFAQLGTQLGETAKKDLPQAARQFQQFVKLAGGGSEKAHELLNAMPDYKAALIDLASGMGKTLSGQELLNLAQGKGTFAAKLATKSAARQAAALAKLSGTAVDAKGDISDLAKEITNFGKAEFDAEDTDRALHQAIDDVTSKLKDQVDAYKQAHGNLNGFTKSLDINTQNGRDNSAALEQIAKSALAHAAAVATQTGSQEQATAAINDGRAALINALAQFGVTGQAAQEYADKLGLIPSNVSTLIKLNKSQAQIDAENLIDTLNRVQRNIDIAVTLHGANHLATTGGLRVANANGGMYSYADGGFGAGIYSGGAPLYKFAEPETRWEAFISGKPGQEARSRQIWAQAGRKLGMGPSGAASSTTVSLAGATILMSVDGRQMTAVIQDQIVSASRAQKTGLQGGMQEVAY